MSAIKNFLPDWFLNFIRPIYHGSLAFLANIYFGRPSEKMVVIGVTGTTGKSTTIGMLAHILNQNGKKCGFITTVNFYDGQTDYINKHGLSMPGGWLLQKQLLAMLSNGCKYAIVECTSEGLAQNRHLGINFDMAVFTNLSRAHLESHGSFGNYKTAKGKLFLSLQKGYTKSFFPHKVLGVNLDDPMSGYFLSFRAEKKFGVTFKNLQVSDLSKIYRANITQPGENFDFVLNGIHFNIEILGEFNMQNAALAAACADVLGEDLPKSAKTLANFHGIRGRMESVPNKLGVKVIIDYGCEPASFKSATEAAAQLPHNRLIHVFGSTGGHRDSSKRFDFGKTSAQFADFIIIANDDIYDSDPQEIANNIVTGITSFKLRQPKYEIILDRRSAILKALQIAQPNDVVLITGKGSEQFLVLPGNRRIDWDEKKVVREELQKLEIGKNL
jgi:UDP-N-acetylmuramoyl-L-alanyl-D-glutamate--2,6-diaminopimelate ligase